MRSLTKRRSAFELNTSGRVGFALCAGVTLIALVGPLVAPKNPASLVGSPYESPSSEFLLGTDFLGRDAFSRFLHGGQTALLLAFLGTIIAHFLGITAGILAAYSRGTLDAIFNRVTETFLALPGLIFLLLVIAGFGTSLKILVIGVGLAGAPRVARLVRGAAIEIRQLSFVEVAEARGESRYHIVRREILPNILAPIAVDFGIRLASSIIVVAGVSFLGLGLQPPASDWGLIVSENRSGLRIQPWAIIGPLLAIGFVTVGINLMIDGLRRGKRQPSESIALEIVR